MVDIDVQLENILRDYVDGVSMALTPKPSRIIHVTPGTDSPWDECCAGQLWGAVTSINPWLGNNTTAAAVPCGILGWNATLKQACTRLRCSKCEVRSFEVEIAFDRKPRGWKANPS